jgi:hypothetical protein
MRFSFKKPGILADKSGPRSSQIVQMPPGGDNRWLSKQSDASSLCSTGPSQAFHHVSGTCTTEVPVLFIILHRDLVHTMTLPCYVVILGRDLVHTMALPCSVVILGRELVQTVTHPCYQD